MKQNFLYIITVCMLCLSCEDVINVDLNTAEPKLVIDASINWIKQTTGNEQSITLTLTAPFFENEVPVATGATVSIIDSNNNIFSFLEENNSGIYKTNSFIPVLNQTYTLNITYDNEDYTATETLLPVVPIEFIEQKNDGGFSGDETEIKAFYTDPKDIENYYLFEFAHTETGDVSLDVYDDEFTDGNQIFAFFSEEDIQVGETILIRNSGISRRFFNYLNILLQQTDEDSGDPFQTQPATVKGNCINTSNPKNFPFGYFRLSETSIFNYTIE